jgi:hypothetical protein
LQRYAAGKKFTALPYLIKWRLILFQLDCGGGDTGRFFLDFRGQCRLGFHIFIRFSF